nr:MAG TPA: hypothetical protein [Caudoviricetes sp.]
MDIIKKGSLFGCLLYFNSTGSSSHVSSRPRIFFIVPLGSSMHTSLCGS